MALKTPLIYEIAPDTYAINEFGLAAMYLAVGTKRAVLIDTGCGICNLPEIVGKLTDKPLTVVLTHGHLDHCGGIGWFDEVYVNGEDHEMVRGTDPEEIRRYAEIFGKCGSYDVYEYSPDTLKGFDHMPDLLPLNEGDVIDLGGRTLEPFEIAGHTRGGIAFLDAKNRIMFSGDCCNTNLLALECSVARTQEALEKFRSLTPGFDQNYNGHVGFMGFPSCFSQPGKVADDLITACRLIRSSEAAGEPYQFLWQSMTKLTYGCAGLCYDPEWIEEDGNM